MKLNDICSNGRFIKGELNGSFDNKYFLNNSPSIVWGKESKRELCWYNGEGERKSILFELIDFTRDDWKLYEFIDGKMVEYVSVNEDMRDEGLNGYLAQQICDNMLGITKKTWEHEGKIIHEKIFNSKAIMQPIEAIRWMRDNPGRVIEAVECGTKFKSATKEFSILVYLNNKWINYFESFKFFAYTYRIVEVQE